MNAVGLLRNLTEQPESAVILFLLGGILNRFNSTDSASQELLTEVPLANGFCNLITHCMLQNFLEIGEDLIAEGIPQGREVFHCMTSQRCVLHPNRDS